VRAIFGGLGGALGVMVRARSCLSGPKPRNLTVSAEFLRFRGILQNLVLAGDKEDKYAIFWSSSRSCRKLITIAP